MFQRPAEVIELAVGVVLYAAFLVWVFRLYPGKKMIVKYAAHGKWTRNAGSSGYVKAGEARKETGIVWDVFEGFGRLLSHVLGLALWLAFWLFLLFVAVSVVSCAWHLWT